MNYIGYSATFTTLTSYEVDVYVIGTFEFYKEVMPMPYTVNDKRAFFVYEAGRLYAIASECPVIPEPFKDREEPFKEQFCQVVERQCGENRSNSPEELHGSWMQAYYAMGWKYGEQRDTYLKTHPDLVPFEKLGQLEKNKDAVFIALCEIARQWI